MPVYFPALFITLASFPDKNQRNKKNNNHDIIRSPVKRIRNPGKVEVNIAHIHGLYKYKKQLLTDYQITQYKKIVQIKELMLSPQRIRSHLNIFLRLPRGFVINKVCGL